MGRKKTQEKESESNKFQHSEYQLAIFDWIKNGTGNAIVSAVAGSGKTTTIIDAISFLPEGSTVLFLSFNKEIQMSTRAKLDERKIKGVHVYTNHSLGSGLISASIKFARPTLNENKYQEIYDTIFEAERMDSERKHEKLLDLQKKSMDEKKEDRQHTKSWRRCFCSEPYFTKRDIVLDFVKYGRMFGTDDIGEIAKNIEYMGESYDKSISLEFVEKAYTELVRAGREVLGEIDFLDMLWIPVKNSVPFSLKWSFNFDFVFLDECQDLNAMQIKLVQHAIKETNARLLAVGDPKQAIYGFAGALPTAWDEVRTSFDAKVFPLSVCYRCGHKIVSEAQKIVEQIKPSENSDSGSVGKVEDFSIQFILENIDAVLSRFHAPLVRLLCLSIKTTDRFRIAGEDFGREFKSYVLSASRNDGLSLRERIVTFFQKKIERTKKDFVKKTLADKMEAVLFFEEISDHTAEGVILLIDKYMSDKPKKGEILLSTIHRSKGREWDNVLVLGYSLMPHFFPNAPAWQCEQEVNLKYIATTRAKKHLWEHCPQNILWYKQNFLKAEPTQESSLVPLGTVLESKKIAESTSDDAEALYQIEREMVLAKGSKSEVPEWARPAIKYLRHPENHGLNVTISDFPKAETSAMERYNAWLEKK